MSTVWPPTQELRDEWRISEAEYRRDYGPDDWTDDEAAQLAQDRYEKALGWGCD